MRASSFRTPSFGKPKPRPTVPAAFAALPIPPKIPNGGALTTAKPTTPVAAVASSSSSSSSKPLAPAAPAATTPGSAKRARTTTSPLGTSTSAKRARTSDAGAREVITLDDDDEAAPVQPTPSDGGGKGKETAIEIDLDDDESASAKSASGSGTQQAEEAKQPVAAGEDGQAKGDEHTQAWEAAGEGDGVLTLS